MTVSELIAKLQELPQHLVVRVETTHEVGRVLHVEEFDHGDEVYVDIVGRD